MDKVSVTPTSRDSAIADDVVLRETSTSRLVFKPLIVNNSNDTNAAIHGAFVYQRKGRNDEWIDVKDLPLSALHKSEWIKLDVKSAELLKLFRALNELYCLYSQEGVPRQKTQFIKIESHLDALINADKDELARILEIERELGLQMFLRLLDWFTKAANREQLVGKLETLAANDLQSLNTLVGVGNLKTALTVWHQNKNNPNEEFWQQTLARYSFVLSQVFSFPVIILKGKAYVGGKGIENTGGNVVDFLVTNQLTKNTALVEIKTPKTPLIAQEYRGDIHNIEREVVGAVMQVSNYRDRLLKQYNMLASDSHEEFQVFDPQCLIIVGNLEREKLTANQRKSFELFRNGLKDVRLITYDELFGKVQILIDLLEGNNQPEIEEDIPF